MRLRFLSLACLCAALIGGCYEEPVAIVTLPPDDGPPTVRPTTPRPSVQLPTAAPSVSLSTSPPTPIDLSTPTPGPRTAAPPTTVATPTLVPATATPVPNATALAGGSPSPGCEAGWIVPSPITPEFDEGFLILEGIMGVEGPWAVTEMRYFTGPDSVGIIEPRYDVVERWYIRASLATDQTYRGRWLLEKRTDLVKGVAAVAPWDSTGYESPDWTGFVGEGEPQTYIGLPGQWSGIPYDFVTGEGDSGNPGLPPEVVGCLSGT